MAENDVNRQKWNQLYANAVDPNRPEGEIASVPNLTGWEEGIPVQDEYLIKYINSAHKSIIDIGTGFGAVLGNILLRESQMIGVGFDISNEAIRVARKKAEEYGLAIRCSFYACDMHNEWDFINDGEKFDIIMANFALQFNTYQTFIKLMKKVDRYLSPGGLFIAKMRSSKRSVPDTYQKYEAEENTYISREPHEYGMIYHHFSMDDIMEIQKVLNGTVLHHYEAVDHREYDRFPTRAWHEIVVKKIIER